MAEIPFLAKFKMNFLMNCYLSMFTDPEKLINRWWEPIPGAKKKAYAKVVESCRKHGLDFCFAIHPQLFSERPLRYDSEEDFRDLWQHFAWMQGLGVRLFSVSYDDIAVEGQDKAALARAQAKLVNRVLDTLRRKDPKARMIFCPVYYWGDGSGEDAGPYLAALAGTLDPEVLVFWTGDGIITGTITAKAAEAYKRTVGHRLVIWDNYPVNDRSGALHLGPVTGRDARLAGIAEGYMSNPLAPQNEINRIPLATCADFAWNPWAYDPARSIGQAILHLAGTAGQRTVLRDLVELYPGDLACGSTRTDYNSVIEEYKRLSARPETRPEAEAFAARVADVVARFVREFPGSHAPTKATLHQHLARLGKS
jgi:hyaluronoglucosaminidase